MELGKKIKQLRYKAGFTQEQLAERLGVAAQSISKWENNVAHPDIFTLPLIAETFGVTIDDLFSLSIEQKLNRIENHLDLEEDLPSDIFREYEEFLKGLTEGEYKVRSLELLAYLYWRKAYSAANMVKYAKQAISLTPNKKECQYTLCLADGHVCWDWNLSNHLSAISFYRDVVTDNPLSPLPYLYLIDNLIADNRIDDAEEYLKNYVQLDNYNKIMADVYPAYFALGRYDEKKGDEIILGLLKKHENDSAYLFEIAQYYAKKGDYDKALEYYEDSFEKDEERPRFQDALMAQSRIYEIKGDYVKAAEVAWRIIELLKNEWKITEGNEYQEAIKERDRLQDRINRSK